MNAQAKDLQVEIMDENGNVITGFSREDCKEMNDLSSTKQLVTWKSGKKLAALSGKIVKVKFYVTCGDLYAFWISPWDTGESRGYTGGGPFFMSTFSSYLNIDLAQPSKIYL